MYGCLLDFLSVVGYMEFSKSCALTLWFPLYKRCKSVTFVVFLLGFNFYSEINYSFQTLKFLILSRTPDACKEYK